MRQRLLVLLSFAIAGIAVAAFYLEPTLVVAAGGPGEGPHSSEATAPVEVGAVQPAEPAVETPAVVPSEAGALPAVALFAPDAGGNSGTSLVEQSAVDLVNSERVLRGAVPLVQDQNLTAAAREWSLAMQVSGYAHSSPDRLRMVMENGGFGSLGENIHAPERQCTAASPCESLAAQPTSGVLVFDWMNSTEHRDNLMDPRWTSVGAGVSCTPDGRMWAVMLFARPHGAAPADPAHGSLIEPIASWVNGGYECSGQVREHNPAWVHPAPH